MATAGGVSTKNNVMTFDPVVITLKDAEASAAKEKAATAKTAAPVDSPAVAAARVTVADAKTIIANLKEITTSIGLNHKGSAKGSMSLQQAFAFICANPTARTVLGIPASFTYPTPNGVIKFNSATDPTIEMIKFIEASAHEKQDGYISAPAKNGNLRPAMSSIVGMVNKISIAAQKVIDTPAAKPTPAPATPPKTATATAAAPALPVYIHNSDSEDGVQWHDMSISRSGHGVFEGVGYGNKDNGKPNLGMISGAERMVDVKGHGFWTGAGHAVGGFFEMTGGAVRAAASAPYLAVDQAAQALDEYSNANPGAWGWLVGAFNWVFVKGLAKIATEAVSFVGGVVSAPFLLGRGFGAAWDRVKSSASDLELSTKADAKRAHQQELDLIHADSDLADRAPASLTATQADMVAQNARMTSLKATIAALKVTIADEKDPTELAQLNADLAKDNADLATATTAYNADQAKITAFNASDVASQKVVLQTAIDDINATIKEDNGYLAQTNQGSATDRRKRQAELNDLNTKLAKQQGLLDTLNAPQVRMPANAKVHAAVKVTAAKGAGGALPTPAATVVISASTKPQSKPLTAAEKKIAAIKAVAAQAAADKVATAKKQASDEANAKALSDDIKANSAASLQ